MSNSVSAFISELIRDANQIEKLGDFEKSRMLERAVTTIKDMREQLGLLPGSTLRDPVIDLQIAAELIPLGHTDDGKVKRAMLEAAEILRTLKIVRDANDELKKL
ncbi:hypothetical protein IB237_14900 [Agrobacterium sp. AGB01]|uniref:hypothetical protein n=1 Tax=Agrobacterium sp. AGB01 TaxID=2769302 RepID=UPI00177D645F|nr:hypothetical protein [Agrobacterium sp. AGB01]MBD9388470.1 hypothetical protein [Agrobacterium sp. AGB01]